MTRDTANRRRRGKLFPAEAKREIERLRAADADLESAMLRLERFDGDDIEISVTEAKESIAKARGFVDDAIVCIRVDHGLEE